MVTRKRFDKTLFEAFDKKARDAVKSLFTTSDYVVKDNPLKRKVDLLVYLNDAHVFNIETEVKTAFKEQKFPYNTVQITERKGKLASLDKPTLFVMWNIDQTSYICILGKDLISSPLVEVPNRYVFKDEYFYQVPIDKCYYNIEEAIKALEGVQA